MILLIDNYDSFSYNLYQLAGTIRPDIRVIRNDAYTAEEIEKMHPDGIIISPGPGRPEDAGVCIDVICRLAGKVPILGVCLGHQAICKAFGGTVSYAKELMHGKQSELTAESDSLLFRNIKMPFPVARYHSLAALEETLPDELRVTARTADGEVMAVEHRTYPVYGVQFHPESVMTPDGMQIIKNFMEALNHD
ncbi:MAG: aminodeoxychorismate/anthranilate synthase component II [Candidatus Choladocola sp.]|nr:aminodeoxychorismate/anthranilate synthase component II [Candidatus Choladocola sp.]